MEEIRSINKKSQSNLLSISFFIIILLLTGMTHLYNNIIINDIKKIETEIATRASSIKEIKKDKNIQIYSLLKSNKQVLDTYNIMNKIPVYINHLNIIQAKYDLKFTGFSLHDGKLFSSVEIISDDKGIAFQKTRDFIKNYRLDPKSLFELSFINQVQGMDKMKFKVSFKIKD